MTHEEYEQRKLRLAEQLREGVALLEEGYQLPSIGSCPNVLALRGRWMGKR